MRVAILGNSGSGKSTLAHWLARSAHLAVLDLDSVAFRSRQEQDATLQFLLAWVAEYYTRDGPMSLAGHQAVFDRYPGRKTELLRVPQLNPPDAELSTLRTLIMSAATP